MTFRGVWTVARVEQSKFAAQIKVRLLLAACVAGPFIFEVAMRVQSGVPSDTLFGRAVTDSGFAVPLVVLGFAALWPFPLLASIIGGDIFSAEDRYGTWTTVLSRSRSRAEVFAGKVIAALAFSLAAVTTLAASSVTAGVLVIGPQPLIDLSGLLLPSSQAATRVFLAWLSILAPTWGFTAMAVLLSVATRSSAAGIGLPIVIGLLMQLVAFVDGPDAARVLLLGTAFGAWHGLFADPQFLGPLIRATLVSVLYLATCLLLAYRLLLRRDIAG